MARAEGALKPLATSAGYEHDCIVAKGGLGACRGEMEWDQC